MFYGEGTHARLPLRQIKPYYKAGPLAAQPAQLEASSWPSKIREDFLAAVRQARAWLDEESEEEE